MRNSFIRNNLFRGNRLKNKQKKIFAYLFSIFFIILFWTIFAKIIDSNLILPTPLDVFFAIVNLCTKKIFWQNVLVTMGRTFCAFFVSVLIGFVLGTLCGYSEFFNSFLKIPLSIIRATPIISIILLILFWFKSGTVPIVTSVLMSLPIMITSIHNGFLKIDNSLLQMAIVFNLTKIQVFKNIVLKSITPFFWNGVLSTFGLSWKVVVASEVLSLPAKSVGTILHKSQIHLEVQEVFAITIIVVCISFIFERLLDFFIKKTFGKNYANETK